jgi:glycine/D-amino acid oxidase-like deaminating enzyme
MASTDILVVGGGIVGQVAAIELAEAGARVTIVDAASNAGSTANAGSLHVQMQSRFMRLYPDQVPKLEASLPFYQAAAEEWVALDAAHGPFELVRNGGLMLAESPDQLAFLEAKAGREARKGLSVEMLDRTGLERIAPWLGPQILGAELCRDEGKLNPLTVNNRLRTRVSALDIRCVTDRIGRIDHAGSGVTARGVSADYRADRVIVAAAWGAGDLMGPHDLTIPTRAEPLHMNITEAGGEQIRHLIQHAERSITLKQLGSGQVVIGGGWPARDRGRDAVPGVEMMSVLGNVALAARLAPSIGGLRILRTWAGMNTVIDGASVIGSLPATDRIMMALPGDAGYTLGPLVARMVAAMMLGRTPPHDPVQFAPSRFAA